MDKDKDGTLLDEREEFDELLVPADSQDNISSTATSISDARKPVTRDYVTDYPSTFIIRSFMQTILNRSRFIIFMFLIFIILGAIASFLFVTFMRSHTGVAHTVVTFNFPEAQNGRGPDGMPLDINMIRSPHIIANALVSLDYLDVNVSIENIRRNMHIGTITPHNVLDSIQLMRESAVRTPERLIELDELIFHPTQFIIRLYRGSALSELSEQDMVDLINAIISSYVEYFTNTYNEISFLNAVFTHFDPTDYEYFEIVQILRGTTANMLSFINLMQEEDPIFRSPRTMMTFGDIQANLRLVYTVDIHRISSLVYVNNMSRNRSRSANLITYNIMRLEMDYAVARANADDTMYMLREVYEREEWSFVHHNAAEHLMHARHSDTYDEYFRELHRFMVAANAISAEIGYYRNRLESLRVGTLSDPADVAFVESAIPAVFEKLANFETIINLTVEDYINIRLFQDAIQIQSPGYFESLFGTYLFRIAVIIIAASLIGILVAVLIVLYQGERYDNKVLKKLSIH